MKTYKLNEDVSKDIVRSKFAYNGSEYILRTPVYKYKNKAVIWLKITIDINEHFFDYTVVNSEDKLYAPVSDGSTYVSVVRKIINNNVKKQLEKLVKLNILEVEE